MSPEVLTPAPMPYQKADFESNQEVRWCRGELISQRDV